MRQSLGRVLVVEDDELVRQVITTMVGLYGGQPVAARLVEQALTHDLDDIDLAIIDVGLPGKAGTELRNTLASRAPHIGCLLVSGYPDHALDLTPGEREHFLMKPFSSCDFERALFHLVATNHTRPPRPQAPLQASIGTSQPTLGVLAATARPLAHEQHRSEPPHAVAW